MEDISLNAPQLLAVNHFKGPMMALAGPGSGKTTVIIQRVINLIRRFNVLPADILVTTFSKAAATSIQQRLLSQDQTGVLACTFHSLFYRIISANNQYKPDCIIKDDERISVIRNLSAKYGTGTDEQTQSAITREISFVKNEMIDILSYKAIDIEPTVFRQIFNAYEDYKTRNIKIDFDDFAVICHKLLTENKTVLSKWRRRFKYILIDEFQDINKIQYECMRMLAAPANNLFIVGDDDQSIYRFRGAHPEYLLNFQTVYKNAVMTILNINYRSTDSIIRLSDTVIKENTKRFPKEIKGTGRQGPAPKVLRNEDTEGEAAAVTDRIKKLAGGMVDYSKIACLYRINLQSRALIDSFVNSGIPFCVRDEAPSIYEHFTCRDIIAYLALSQNVNLPHEAERIINKPSRYIHNTYIKEAARKGKNGLIINLVENKKLKDYQRSQLMELIFQLSVLAKRGPIDGYKYIREVIGYDEYLKSYCQYKKMKPAGLLEILDELQEGAKAFDNTAAYLRHIETAKEAAKTKPKRTKTQNGVTLSTLHGAKGLEFDAVFIISAVSSLIPHEKSLTPDDIEEERRLFYVGITRAKELLYISTIEKRYDYDVEPTEFLPGLKRE